MIKQSLSASTQSILADALKQSGLDRQRLNRLQKHVGKTGSLPSMQDLHESSTNISRKSLSSSRSLVKHQAQQSFGSSRRSFSQIVELTEGYQRPDYRPRPTKDGQQEKLKWIQRLESLSGQAGEEPGWTKSQLARMRSESGQRQKKEDEEDLDEIDMLIEEIEERKQWLEEMSDITGAAGAAGYQAQVRAEISLRIARLKQLKAL